jgi:RNA polymerase sigma factor (sigma-70 family)
MHDVARLFQDHHRALCRYLFRFTGDADAAADAAQEAFSRALDRPPNPASARAWLYTVATNVARQAGRTERRRTRLLAHAPGRAPIGDAEPGPLERLEADERRARVHDALLTLHPKERTALLMREEGFTQREIAAAVGATPQGVGSLIARALTKLAARLRLDEEEP